MSKRGTLQAEYDALLAKTSGWEAETRKMLREHDEERKRGVEQRKAGLKELLKRKGEVHTALQLAIAEENAEAIAEEALKPEKPGVVIDLQTVQIGQRIDLKPGETIASVQQSSTVTGPREGLQFEIIEHQHEYPPAEGVANDKLHDTPPADAKVDGEQKEDAEPVEKQEEKPAEPATRAATPAPSTGGNRNGRGRHR